ncbi:hypothetical protein [Anaeromyxobacter sp. Fw109-5]|uniref:hypothetical protein n=1 Tax=Anaeromyxobacter sp. (strain Fw109-5) TaxID=404589 RepID=UPI000158A681|nr:hypothetical protein [Anaeromyxobacter sp. Fw109-5]ABS24848.1 hypothetical protein Anae109_0635 [Anaeromyxobacter sp. Fw109-5]
MRTCAVLTAIAAALAGCSGPKDAPTPRPDTSTIGAFCDAMLAAYSSKLASCYRLTPATIEGELDGSQCRAYQAFADAGRLTYDAAQASRCVAEMQAASCEQFWFWNDPGAPSCASVFAGHTPPGSSCAVSEACAGGRCTDWTDHCSGTCVAWLAAGEACDLEPWGCAPGLACDAGQVPPRCAVPSYAGEGQACGAFGCGVGLWCDGDTCRAKTATGSCATGEEACAAGSYCRSGAADEARCVPLVGVGEACGAAVLCGPGSHCDAASGRCAEDPGPGEPCAEQTEWGDGCARSWCDAGTCRAFVPEGEACTQAQECGPLSCITSVGGGLTCVDEFQACMP